VRAHKSISRPFCRRSDLCDEGVQHPGSHGDPSASAKNMHRCRMKTPRNSTGISEHHSNLNGLIPSKVKGLGYSCVRAWCGPLGPGYRRVLHVVNEGGLWCLERIFEVFLCRELVFSSGADEVLPLAWV
jgi:hypothetical protein